MNQAQHMMEKHTQQIHAYCIATYIHTYLSITKSDKILSQNDELVLMFSPLGIKVFITRSKESPDLWFDVITFYNSLQFPPPSLVIELHLSTARSSFKPPYSTALLLIMLRDLSQHS